MTGLHSLRPWRCLACSKNLRLLQQRRHITLQELDDARNGRERIVILGSGWAGYTLGRELDSRKFQAVIVSPRSYFVFTPLLASTAVGTLEFRTALEPVRKRNMSTAFFQGWCDGVEVDKKEIEVEEAVEDPRLGKALVADRRPYQHGPSNADKRKGRVFKINYDALIVAVGCYSQTFGIPGVRENAYFLKDVGDARRIRNQLLSCFETAALPTTSAEMQKRLLSFAVVGGGPTGIELSAELHDLIREDMSRVYPELVHHAKITVYDVAPKVLNMFDDKLAQYAMDSFHRGGIAIKTEHHVESLRLGATDQGEEQSGSNKGAVYYTLRLKEEGDVDVGMCVWSTGLMTNPLLEKGPLSGKVKRDAKTKGLVTDDHLRVKGTDDSIIPHVYALGDCAVMDGTAYPATAQVANQKATWLAKRLNQGNIEKKSFTYRDLGIMAYVGNWNAILQSQGGDVSGRVAWFIWRGAYLTKSVSWRNRILIPIYWVVNWVFGRDISRF